MPGSQISFPFSPQLLSPDHGPSMDPLSITTGIAGLAALAYQIIGYLGTVRAGGKDRLALCNEVTYLWMSITSLLEQLSPDATKDEKIPDSLRPLFQPDGILNEIKIQLEDLETKIKSRSSHGKIAQTLAWPFTQSDAEKIIQRIHRLKSTLQDGINQSTHAIAQDIYRDGQSVKNSVDETRLKELIDWISPLNFITKQSMIWNEHHKGTCKWFLERDDFREWREGENTKIFCPGIPGAGKTFLSSIVYNELDGLRVREEGGLKGAAVVMLYCKWDDPLSQDVDNLMSSIIKQFVQRYNVGVNEMMELFSTHSKEGTRPSADQLHSTLHLLIGRFTKVFVILDGLDELRDENRRRPLLEFLSPRKATSKTIVNLMVTSRPLPNIVRHFRQSPGSESQTYCDICNESALPMYYHCADCTVSYDLCSSCYLEPKRCGYKAHSYHLQFDARVIPIAAVEEDLTTYVRWRTSASDFLQQCVEVKEGLMDKILTTVVKSNGGMFLLAKFNMDTLDSKLNIKQLMLALKTLPQELDGTYADAMLRITELPPSTRAMVLEFLRWVVFAEQPLHEKAIEHALAVSEGDVDIDDDDIIRARTLASKCAGLVQFDESDCLRLVHYSAEGFFEQNRDHWFPQGNIQVTSSCLTYLRFDAFRAGACTGPSEAVDFEKRVEKYPFLRYASINWGKHLLATSDDNLFNRALGLLTDPDCLSTITQALWYLEDQQQSISWSAKDGSAIHLAAHYNLNRLVEELLARGYDPNITDINGSTPLALAVRHANINIVTALIRAGASVNPVDNKGRAPLHWAIWHSRFEVFKLLLDQTAIDVNISDARWSHYTPLMVAASSGYTDYMELLLAAEGIDVNKQCKSPDGGTALTLAARQGATDAVKLLLAHPSIEINHSDASGTTALNHAAQGGYYGLVEVLLDKGADTEVRQKGSDGTAIMRAIDDGKTSIVQLLINRGANVHHTDVFDRGTLQSAAVNRRADIIRILLAHDPTLDVNRRDAHGETTMHDIARMGDIETADLLLEHGGDPTIKDNYGRTPIRIAHESHHPAILEIFRAARARQKAEGRVSKAPLQRTDSGTIIDEAKRSDTGLSIPGTLPLWSLVVSKQITELKERLSDASKEEIDQTEPDMGQSALHWATGNRDTETVNLLISHGADINLRSRYGRTPLHLSVMAGHWETTATLLRAGADPNINDQWGYPPLAMSDSSVGLLLIENGAKLSRETVNMQFFLGLAVQIGWETSVRRLIAAGADVWSKDATGRTPYMIAKENDENKIANLILQLAPRPEASSDGTGTPKHKVMNGNAKEKDSTEAKGSLSKVNINEASGKTTTTSAAKPGTALFGRYLYTLLLLLILVSAPALARLY
ncbi:ankyrin repeat-containing domain protein [Aspergillus varians]